MKLTPLRYMPAPGGDSSSLWKRLVKPRPPDSEEVVAYLLRNTNLKVEQVKALQSVATT